VGVARIFNLINFDPYNIFINKMKNHTYIVFILVISSILLSNCEKEKVITLSKYYSEFNDSVWMHISYYGDSLERVDVDNDSIDDIEILVHRSYSGWTGSVYFIQLTPINGCEIMYDVKIDTNWSTNISWPDTYPDTIYTYDTSKIVRINNVGDNILFNDLFTNEPIKILYFEGRNYKGSSTEFNFTHWHQWLDIGYKYLVLRKNNSSIKNLAWLKVRVYDKVYYGITYQSSYYFENQNQVIIENYP
jgi:hypothetical protein